MEKGVEGQLDLQAFADLSDESYREQRMTAEFGEVVVHLATKARDRKPKTLKPEFLTQSG